MLLRIKTTITRDIEVDKWSYPEGSRALDKLRIERKNFPELLQGILNDVETVIATTLKMVDDNNSPIAEVTWEDSGDSTSP